MGIAKMGIAKMGIAQMSSPKMGIAKMGFAKMDNAKIVTTYLQRTSGRMSFSAHMKFISPYAFVGQDTVSL